MSNFWGFFCISSANERWFNILSLCFTSFSIYHENHLQFSQYITYAIETELLNKLAKIRSIIVVFIKLYNQTTFCTTGPRKI
jgi:hypothetical protein